MSRKPRLHNQADFDTHISVIDSVTDKHKRAHPYTITFTKSERIHSVPNY